MPKYKVKYVYEKWYDLEIEAPTLEQAKEIFWSGDYEDEPYEVGGQLADGAIWEEVSNA